MIFGLAQELLSAEGAITFPTSDAMVPPVAAVVADQCVGEKTPQIKLTKAGKKAFADTLLPDFDTPSTAASTSEDEAECTSSAGSEELSCQVCAIDQGKEDGQELASFAVDEVPAICGYMYKKSPQRFRITAWDQRFFVVANMKMLWWKDRKSCALDVTGRERATTEEIESEIQEVKPLPRIKGMVNFAVSEPKVVAMFSAQTRFRMLAPSKGWRAGATSDKRNDAARDYEFDVEGSSRSRSEWVTLLRRHIEQAEEKRRFCDDESEDSNAGSEYWEDATVDDSSRLISNRFWIRAQENKVNRE